MMSATKQTFVSGVENFGNEDLQYLYPSQAFDLEGGQTLSDVRIGYQTFGQLNSDRSNVVWVFHALTANSNPIEWWPGLVGENEVIDPKNHFIVCANVLGSCYGSTGPKDFSPIDGERYLNTFPSITIRDMVKAHQLLKAHLQIDTIALGIGGSMGAQQLLEWAIEEPSLFEHIVTVASSAKSSPWGIAIRSAQRMAIEADPSFYSSSPRGGWKGLEAARAMALTSYRTAESYNQSQIDKPNQLDNYQAESYQRYQGAKLNKRFDARTYYTLSKAMDTHDVSRHRGTIQEALALIKAEALIIGIEGDLLFTPNDQQDIADNIPNAQLQFISSKYGHDGFLLEAESISKLIQKFFNS